MRQGDVVHFLHTDHLGSTSLTTNQAGGVVAQSRYLPYGELRWTDGETPTDFTFTGQRAEPGFGLLDYNARYYDAGLGRFISPDTIVPNPANPQSLNRYAYTYNNPLKYRDSSGHFGETLWDIANIVIGVGSLCYNLSEGNYVDAAIDTGGLVVDVAATALPFVPGGAGAAIKAVRVANKVDNVVDAVNAADNVVDTVNAVDNVVDAANQIDEAGDVFKHLNDDEVLYQYSRRPRDGQYQGFPNTLREGEAGMSCQVASMCGGDPVQGFRQQFPDRVDSPSPGDWVRETSVGDVKNWGGRAEYDGFPGNPHGMPEGHATIYSEGGKWGKPFDKIWENKRPLLP